MKLKCSWGENLDIDPKKYKNKKEFTITSPGNDRHKHVFRWKADEPVEVMHFYFPDD